MRISDWSSDVCSSDLYGERDGLTLDDFKADAHGILVGEAESSVPVSTASGKVELAPAYLLDDIPRSRQAIAEHRPQTYLVSRRTLRSMNSWMNNVPVLSRGKDRRSEEHTSELQSLLRTAYDVLCWKQQKKIKNHDND